MPETLTLLGDGGHANLPVSGTKNLSQFPGWEKSGNFIKSLIVSQNAKVVGDVGGGRMPRIDLGFIKAKGVQYHLFDIAQSELDQADAGYQKICMNIACSDNELKLSSAPRNFDLIYSHMLLEHLQDPLQAHRNIFQMLKPGGLSIHMFPSRNNLPLFLNGLIPEAVSYWLLKRLQPHRDTAHEEGKFEAYYKMCGAPDASLRRLYEGVGFEVVSHVGYVGHDYYKRVKPLALIEQFLRPIIIALGLPIISANLLILRKPL